MNLKTIKPLKLIKEILISLSLFLIIYTAFTLHKSPKVPDNPVLTLTDIHGTSYDINTMSQNSPVLVYFWGSWCHICKHTTPNVLNISQDYPVIAVAVNSGNDLAISQFLNQYSKPNNFTVINDMNGNYFNEWQGQVTPSFVIIDKGKITQRFIGIQPTPILKARMAWADL